MICRASQAQRLPNGIDKSSVPKIAPKIEQPLRHTAGGPANQRQLSVAARRFSE